MREKAHGSNHPHVAQRLKNVAEAYRGMNRAAEAEPLEARVAAIRDIER